MEARSTVPFNRLDAKLTENILGAAATSAALTDVAFSWRRGPPYTSSAMKTLTRITVDPLQMGGRPCIRGLRVTVGTVVGLVSAGHTRDEILRLYPYLEDEDLTEALAYAARRADEFEVPLSSK